MNQLDIDKIQEKLGVIFPVFYKDTLLNYPFQEDSFGEEFMLTNNPEVLLNCNGVFDRENKCLAIGSDGGEFIYYIKLNGEEKVYIFDLEDSKANNSVEANNWGIYLENIKKIHLEIEEDEKYDKERKENKKWWQFWI